MGKIIQLEYPDGATPLDPDEVDGLIPGHISTQGQLNEWEQANILEAEKWLVRQRFQLNDILTAEFVTRLHQRMFNKTWRWAGKYRKTDKNIGVDWLTIAVNLKNLLEDARYQVECNSYPLVELAARFHHRLVCVHPFANGNGRHARMMTDILLLSQGRERFLWGRAKSLTVISSIREAYIAALRAADRYDYSLLVEFVQD